MSLIPVVTGFEPRGLLVYPAGGCPGWFHHLRLASVGFPNNQKWFCHHSLIHGFMDTAKVWLRIARRVPKFAIPARSVPNLQVRASLSLALCVQLVPKSSSVQMCDTPVLVTTTRSWTRQPSATLQRSYVNLFVLFLSYSCLFLE